MGADTRILDKLDADPAVPHEEELKLKAAKD